MPEIDNRLLTTAKEVQDFFEARQWRFAFIGGLALLRWGEHRMTKDVDGSLLTLFRDEESYIDEILAHFTPRLNGAKEFAFRNRVLLLVAKNGVEIDLSLGGLWYEENLIARSSKYKFQKNYDLRTCSAEDLIITKSFAARDKDWADVRTILQRQHGKLDLNYVLENLRPLCELKEEPEIVNKLRQMIEQEDRRVV